jgi:hypothetical protein
MLKNPPNPCDGYGLGMGNSRLTRTRTRPTQTRVPGGFSHPPLGTNARIVFCHTQSFTEPVERVVYPPPHIPSGSERIRADSERNGRNPSKFRPHSEQKI